MPARDAQPGPEDGEKPTVGTDIAVGPKDVLML